MFSAKQRLTFCIQIIVKFYHAENNKKLAAIDYVEIVTMPLYCIIRCTFVVVIVKAVVSIMVMVSSEQ